MTKKSAKVQYDDLYEDDDDYRKPKKKDSPRRRPVRNWKKAWVDNAERSDEVDDFYTK